MSPYFFAIIYFIICALYLYTMRHSVEKANRVIFRGLPIAMLIGGTLQHLKAGHVLSVKSERFIPRIYTIVGGLLFSCLAGVYYEFESLQMYGMLCYVISLFMEIYGFSNNLKIFEDLNTNEITLLAVLSIASVILYLYILPKLNFLNMCLVFFFISLDTLLLFVLAVHAFRMPILPHYLGPLGAFILYLSDYIHILHLWRKAIPHHDVVIMCLYYASQIVITGSVVLAI